MTPESIATVTILVVIVVLGIGGYHVALSHKRNLIIAGGTPRHCGAGRSSERSVFAPANLMSSPSHRKVCGRVETAIPSKAEAEELLDWLEFNGVHHVVVSYESERGFVVQYEQQ